jgi:hypothetical protein
MRHLYYRKQRASIYHPATIGDIPQEVLRKAFIYLLPGVTDLVAPSESCRAWRPVAQELMFSWQSFGDIWRKDVERFLCGFHLQSLVFGLGSVSINCLDLDMKFVGVERLQMLARAVAPSLSSLSLVFYDGEATLPSLDCYAVLEVVFLVCSRIRSHLRFEGFDFGDDLALISPLIKEGFGRLERLDLIECQGDVRMFVEAVPIHNLQKLRFESDREDDSAIVMSIAEKYQFLMAIRLSINLDSSAAILKVFDSCRDLETVILSLRDLRLESSDIKALASLPRLKFLDVGFCKMADEAFPSLSRCGKLKRLGISFGSGLNDVLRVIGMNLVSLDIQSAAAETWLGIAENCPTLKHVQLFGEELKDVGMVGSLNIGLKKRMKRLSSMKVNCVSVRLGTDWKGY